MRLFIAVDIPDESKQLINKKVNKIRGSIKQNIKWVNQKNWHLTIKFLGETNRNKICDVENAIEDTALNYNKFTVKFDRINSFPNLKYPKVLFVDIKMGKNILKNIHKDIDKKLTTSGFKPENRNYKPHLTIARSRKYTKIKEIAEKLSKYAKKDFINVDMQAKKICLIKSELKRNGPVYKEIYSNILK